MSFAIFDVLIVFCYLYYGYKFLKNPPPFGDKQGFGMKRTKASPEAWAYGHKVAGIYCVVCGVVGGIVAFIQYVILKDDASSTFNTVTYVMELVLLILLYPVVNLSVKKKFGD